ncbi:TonB-dependent receptor [Corticibacter populi]|uniref:TonB-dependent receptor n=1 Tax=Corticibacter populi TaxID=1550736 RepID=A0A3M6QYL4_9BURK|nr:TonB-dependent receptor [Corticibacter populi]RMX08088.1 TonB-dependent receptor [Corticibacter populi]RZS35336.1 hemoglobin/transferrin/lactoferrin receptor protein [Corticibacter populi]
MNKRAYPALQGISVAVALACWSMAHAQGQEQEGETPAQQNGWQRDAEQALPEVVVTGERTRDEKGQDDVYDKNVTTVYQEREQLQRFQATNPGDAFKGMNGVYSMDTRGSQSITPNIRGLSGEGRVPLTIDGTEQSTNIWLHFFGAGNRSYADPAMFRSIEVEKGPSLSRGIKSGVGGSVNIRTIEPGDIIPEGKNFGIELKADTSGNSSKPRFDAASVYGKDYRDIPGAVRTGTSVAVPSGTPREKGGGENFNFDSHSGMLTIAGRNEMTDFLASYSKRTQGNYYAGKRNAGRYAGHDYLDQTSTDSFTPNMTKLYGAGDEVFNTASETRSTLLKNNWYFPDGQKIGLSFMRNDMDFGETTPGNSVLLMSWRESFEHQFPDADFSNTQRFVFERPHSEMKVDRYKLDYEVKPEDSKWLNLEASLWHTKTRGTRYQTGISPYVIDADDATANALALYDTLSSSYPDFDWSSWLPDHDGTILARGRQWTSHDRTGLDLSNQIKLNEKMQLMLGVNYQREKLDDRVEQTKLNLSSGGLGIDGNTMHASTDFFGPRSGERKEYSATMNLSYQPTPWLTLTAGTRYMRYTGKDTGLAKMAGSRVKTGMQLEYGEILTTEEAEKYRDLSATDTANSQAAAPYINDYVFNGVVTPEIETWLAHKQVYNAFLDGRQVSYRSINDGSGINYLYWIYDPVLVPVINGKPDSSQNPFANGTLNAAETVENTQGLDEVARYATGIGEDVYETLSSGQAWENSAEQSGHAWSPVLSATARIGQFGTGFARYAQTTRFPSIHELTTSSVVDGAGTLGTLAVNGASKPERSTNIEIGYAHNLAQFFPGLALADARISYYNTRIKNFIDRTAYADTIQFDKKKTSGIELQSRFDAGRFFGGLGGTYRLKQEMCDKDFASSMDPYYNRIPTCMTGGFPGTYSGSSLQPKYSINMELGTRLLDRRLEVGWRGTYHAGAENRQLDRLLAQSTATPGTATLPRDVWFRGGVDALYWQSVVLHDLYAQFQVNKSVLLNLNIINLTDQYYMDPMSKNVMPGPGRTITAGMTLRF